MLRLFCRASGRRLPGTDLARTGSVGALLVGAVLFAAAAGTEWLSGIEWPEPRVIEPGLAGGPPSDAVVLFDGGDLAAWQGGENWVVENGVAICRGGDIATRQSFGDCQLHLEWSAPTKIEGRGQDRGNSGVFMMDRYEIQILDSYNNPTYADGQASAIYKQSPPMVNATRPPGAWNTLDILFTAPRFRDDGAVTTPALVTVLHNGVAVQNHFPLLGGTFWHRPPAYEKHPDKQPIRLQFHGDSVHFRNIWARQIKPLTGKRVRASHYRGQR